MKKKKKKNVKEKSSIKNPLRTGNVANWGKYCEKSSLKYRKLHNEARQTDVLVVDGYDTRTIAIWLKNNNFNSRELWQMGVQMRTPRSRVVA